MRLHRRIGAVALLCMMAVACNQLFGIEEGNPIAPPGEAGSSDVSPGGGDASPDTGAGGDAAVDGEAGEQWMFVSVGTAGKSEITFAKPGAASGSADLVGRLTLPASDAVAWASGGRAFVLDRTKGDVFVLDRQSPTDLQKVTHVELGLKANPHAVAVVSDTQAYIIQYDKNAVVEVDLTNVSPGAVIPSKKSIDLSVFLGSDPDVVEMQDAVYVAAQKRVYIALQRIQQANVACEGGAIVVAIDVTTDTIADLNGDQNRDGLDFVRLVGENPYQLTYDAPSQRLLSLNDGCSVDGGPPVGRGIDEVKLDPTPPVAKKILDDPGSFLSGHLYIDSQLGYVQIYGVGWKSYNPTTGVLGPLAGQVPEVPFVDGTGFIVGLANANAGQDAATVGPVWDVYRVDRQTKIGTSVLPGAFKTINAANAFLLSAALVR